MCGRQHCKLPSRLSHGIVPYSYSPTICFLFMMQVSRKLSSRTSRRGRNTTYRPCSHIVRYTCNLSSCLTFFPILFSIFCIVPFVLKFSIFVFCPPILTSANSQEVTFLISDGNYSAIFVIPSYI